MSETKKGVNPWLITVILGVIAILFSVYGLQQQSELKEVREASLKLEEELKMAKMESQVAQAKAKQQTIVAQQRYMELQKALEDCDKKKKK